jgi:CRISPR-associated protein Cas1
MQNRIVEIVTDGAYLNISRGFLIVSIDKQKAGQVAIEDIGALVIRGHGSTLSVNVCARLASANVPVVICGSNQSPDCVIWPVSGHFAQGLHMQAQAAANKPQLKRLWAQLIRAKIRAQTNVLQSFMLNGDDLQSMSKRVKSGDMENLEAQAARRYWQRLMGDNFRRDRNAEGVNAALNYGYTVLRAATARSILAAGLHPSLSLHHQSRGDALRLANDLMEPFRPWVDFKVKKLIEKQSAVAFSLTPEVKTELASILQMDFSGPLGASAMQTCIDRMAQSLVRVFTGEIREIEIASAPVPLVTST